jgi:hypothetical protein
MNIVRINSKKKKRIELLRVLPAGTFFEGTNSGHLFIKTGPKVNDVLRIEAPKESFWNVWCNTDHPARLVDLVEIKYKER